MISRNAQSAEKKLKLRQRFDDAEKSIFFCINHAVSPLSIDTLCELSGQPATKVLGAMEELKKRRFVREENGHPKGTYFFNPTDLSGLVEEPSDSVLTTALLKKLIRHYSEQPIEEEQKTLIMAELYRKIGDTGDGLAFIARAANIFKDRGESENALTNFKYLVDLLQREKLDSSNVDHVLTGLLGKLQVGMLYLNAKTFRSLLAKIRDVAQTFNRGSFYAQAQLDLGFHFLLRQENRRAEQHLQKARVLAEKLDEQPIIRSTDLLITEIRHWKGEASGGLLHYEDTIGEIEELGSDVVSLIAKARQGLWYVIWGKLARGIGIIEAVRAKAYILNLERTVYFCDLMAAHACLELRKVNKAEYYVNRKYSFPTESSGPFIFRIVNIIKAYILFAKMDYEGAFECHRQAADAVEETLMMNHKAAWVFEYLDGLEKKGFIHDKINYDSEVRRTVRSDDIHMRGVGLRYRALRAMERLRPVGEVIADLIKSEDCLLKTGAQMELARTRMAIARFYFQEGDDRSGRSYQEKAGSFFAGTEARDLFPEDLTVTMSHEKKIEATLEAMIRINESLGKVRGKSLFLERALGLAMDFTMATRGAFFDAGGEGEQKIIVSRNLDPLLLHDGQFEYMRRIVAISAGHGIEVCIPGLKTQLPLSDEVPLSGDITSVLCVPARLDDCSCGYLYLDNRLGDDPFLPVQLPYVRLLCSQIAVGLSNIESYEEIKGLKERFEEETIFHRGEMGVSKPLETIIGKSSGIEHVKILIRKVAPTDSSVLIVGETGVGKELVAKAIHNLSERKNGPLIPANLASFPQELVASELFGYEKGSFTGAKERHKGRLELADGGTLFLDEIGDLPHNVQVKLLRVLQEGTFERLGSEKSIRSNFRVIAATNRNLTQEVEKGTFRQDLFYRLNVFPVFIPSLRERREDIPLIAHYFLEKYNQRMGKKIPRIPARELKRLLDYHWPGNVRELEHFIERTVIISDGSDIDFSQLDHLSGSVVPDGCGTNLLLKDVEYEHIMKVLRLAGWRVNGPNGAASMLGVKPTTLFSMMKRLGIKRKYDGL